MLEFYKDAQGSYRWRAKGGNGLIVGASSEGFSSQNYCEENAKKVMNIISDYFIKKQNSNTGLNQVLGALQKRY